MITIELAGEGCTRLDLDIGDTASGRIRSPVEWDCRGESSCCEDGHEEIQHNDYQ